MVRHEMRDGVGKDARGAWRFARAVPHRGTWARETAVQALKAGMAALLAWFVAAHLLHLPQPYLAPWVALVVVRPTMHWSVLTGLRQVSAVALGVLIALLSVLLMPGRELALAVCVPAAFLASYWPRLNDQGLYVPFTALFMVAVDGVDEPFVLFRLLETALGAAIGMGVNLLLAPPVRVLTVGIRARRDATATAEALRGLASRLCESDSGEDFDSSRVHRLDGRAAQSREALRHAREGLRFNPRSGETGLRGQIDRDGSALDLTEQVNRSARAFADLLDDAARDGSAHPVDLPFGKACAAALEAAADAYERRITALLAPDDEPADAGDLTDALAAVEHRADADGPGHADAERRAAMLIAMRRLVRALTPAPQA